MILALSCWSCASRVQTVVAPVELTQATSNTKMLQEEKTEDVSPGQSAIVDFVDEATSERFVSSGLGTIEYRQRSYAKRRDQWQTLERQMVALGFEGRPQAWYRCLNEAQTLADQYSVELEEKEQNRVASTNADLLKKDILYLESGCDAVKDAGRDALGKWLQPFTGESTFESPLIWQLLNNEITSLEMARELLAALPEHRLEPEVRHAFALAQLRSGQLEAATNLLAGNSDKILLGHDAIALQQLVADLLLATGRVDDARQHYEALEGLFSNLHEVDRWVTGQLALLRSDIPQSESFALFLTIMRSYLLFDGRIVPAGMENGVARLEQAEPGSSISQRGRQLLVMVENNVLYWVESRLEKADELVEKMEYEAAFEILQELTGLEGLGAVPDQMVHEAVEKVQMVQSLELETQRMLQEQELAIQWENALTLFELKQFDEAIAIFSNLQDTGYQDQAKEKIIEASNLAAKQLRRQASSLFVEARKAVDQERKKVLLRESLDMLRTIGIRYPETEILEKVRQNLNYLEEYIGRFDPTLLEVPDDVEETSQEAPIVEVEEEILN